MSTMTPKIVMFNMDIGTAPTDGKFLSKSIYNCTSREEMGGRWGFFTQIEPNWTLPYSTVPEPLLRDARPAGWVTYYSICASTMPRAQNSAGIGSILLWRRLALAILLLFIYDHNQPMIEWANLISYKAYNKL